MGWVSFEYTKKEKRPAFRYRLTKEGENQKIRFLTLVAPYRKNIPDIQLELIENSKDGSSEFQILIDENGKQKRIEYKL